MIDVPMTERRKGSWMRGSRRNACSRSPTPLRGRPAPGCIGLFGLMSYSVSRRTNEIGIRMALGAQRAGVVSMVLRESMLMVVIGVVVGLAGAIAGGRFVQSVLFGLTPTDVWTISGAIGATVLVSLAAGYLPARRASRVDPMVALRYE